MRRFAASLLFASILTLPASLGAQATGDAAAQPLFGLAGPNLFESHRRASNLTVADLNGDGLPDIATVSNDEGVLRLLYGQPEKDASSAFKSEEVTLDRIVSSMVATDVNGDGRMDLVLAGSPPSLSIMYQSEDGRLQKGETKDLDAERLVLGDLTNDGRDDLLIVDGTRFDILPSRARDLSLEPSRTFFAAEDLSSRPRIADLNGDGRNDLLYSPATSNERLIVRLQSPEGDFPSEVSIPTGQLRLFDTLPGKGGDLVAAIHGTTRQLVLLELEEPIIAKDAGLVPSAPHVVGLDPDTYADNSLPVVADFDGDGRDDLAVALPGAPSLRLLRQTRTGGLAPRQLPALEDIRQAVAWKGEAGKPTPLLVLSGKEKTLAIARIDPENPARLQFPDPLSLQGEPLAMTAAQFGRQQKPTLATVEKTGDEVRVMAYPNFDPAKSGTLQGEKLLDLKGNKDAPQSMEALDFNGDGTDELLLLFEFDKPVVLEKKAGQWAIRDTAGVLGGLLDQVKPRQIFPVQLEEKQPPAVFVLKEQYGRVFRLDEKGEVEFLHQFNAKNRRARLSAACTGNFSGNGTLEFALYDRTNKVVTLFGKAKEEGAYEQIAEIEAGDAAFQAVVATDLDGDGRDDLVLVGSDRIVIVYMRAIVGSFQAVASVETRTEEGGYGYLKPLTLSRAGRQEIACVEMKENALEFFDFVRERKETRLDRVYAFRVFDSESSVARRVNLDASPEPRELATADFNEDGKLDLVALVHDMVIVYYQKAD
ncbi:MAG: hypothetical protein PWP23_209 [Candidatus Sumerlaeota bacterium]|nr:hypothetical protein [Candidatus Sumerlaeota bacterium]